jgi:hypothetical protein
MPTKIGPRATGIAMAGLLVAGLAAFAGPSIASAQSGPGMQMSGMQMSGMSMSAKQAAPNSVGNTKGWLAGRTVSFHYTADYFCRQPPTSKAVSDCELGENYGAVPAQQFDPLYVVVPIGFTPPKGTLQCPTAGNCVDHPRHIDLSRVFGNGTGNALLPPHSHVISTANSGKSEWWNVDVIGVKSLQAWNKIVANKNYATIQGMRVAGNPNVTGNIGTNLFLYFSVH